MQGYIEREDGDTPGAVCLCICVCVCVCADR
jgi:hypothetical protein